jgi:single-stranded-DNA-specific exonuclease
MHREWLLLPQPEVPVELQLAVGGHALVARLLTRRGYVDPARALAYLEPSRYTPTDASDLPGVLAAADLLRQAIAAGRRIRVWGDFDVDGQTSTAVLYESLSALGARVDYSLPNRDESHGLHPRAIREALRDDVSLLITCDTGIGDYEAVAQGVEAGITMIVTDHHDLPERLPPAHATLDPKMLPEDHPLRELSGVGVAYMVARALLEGTAQATVLDDLLDLVGLGLVADVATMVNDVRYLVQRGLDALRRTRRPGLVALAALAGTNLAHLTESDIGFQLAPRLNAAGRIEGSEEAGQPLASEEAVRLLITRERDEARVLADQLEALNRHRQARTETLLNVAEEHIRRDADALARPAIILHGDGWETGVLGLVAGSLARRYGRPAIIIAHRDDQPSVGSARSVPGIDIHEAIASQRHHLLREGGHPMAAGFSLQRESAAAFIQGLEQHLRHSARPAGELSPLTIDAEVPWSELSLDLARQVARLAPFGAGNPRPVLMARGGLLVRSEDVSRRHETAHRRLYMQDDEGRSVHVTWFNAGTLPSPGESVDLAFYVTVNHWQDSDRLQIELVDWRPATATPPSSEALVGGREVVDWRHEVDGAALLQRLRDEYGAELLVWAEGPESPADDALARVELAERSGLALAIWSPPPSPQVLRDVIRAVDPRYLFLFPPPETPQPMPEEFASQVAGMVRVALRDHAGCIDIPRMAARIAASERAIEAALRLLQAMGRIALRREDSAWRVYLPEDAPLPAAADGRPRPVERMRNALAYALGETQAYRQAYATQPVEALLYD